MAEKMNKQEYGFTQTLIDATKNKLSSERKLFISKIAAAIGLYTFLIINSLHDIVSPTYVPECVHDEMQERTLWINQFLAKNEFYRSLLIIIASFMIDVNAIVLTVRFLIFEKNGKIGVVGLAFYIFRGFLQNVFFIRFPTDYIWGHPGLFSITVPYAPANDFFYSGHVGLCTICFVFFKRSGLKFWQYFAFAALVIEFFTLLVTRAHYFIDLVTGLIVAHYIILVIDWVYDYFEERSQKNKAKITEVEAAQLSSMDAMKNDGNTSVSGSEKDVSTEIDD